jgi:hypothetical protein
MGLFVQQTLFPYFPLPNFAPQNPLHTNGAAGSGEGGGRWLGLVALLAVVGGNRHSSVSVCIVSCALPAHLFFTESVNCVIL